MELGTKLGLSQIKRRDWILYHWEEYSEFGDKERTFVRSLERTPDEAMRAGEEWDFLESVKKETEGEEAPAE